MDFAIKAEVADVKAKTFAFALQKTMYGGKHIAKGDTVFVFASENEGGSGLFARGIVVAAEAIARRPGVARQTPRVSVKVRRTARARRPLGRLAAVSSSILPLGMTGGRRRNSTLNSIGRPRIKSSAFLMPPQLISKLFSDTGDTIRPL
ncbi:MAG TPA: hypothetical protein PKE16_03095 [Hyphomicrobium sp.]|nr:hypothetical protein [Hyphomicrobium sp.]